MGCSDTVQTESLLQLQDETGIDSQETSPTEGLLNGGFELIADSTTAPPKFGAYWVGAYSPLEGDGTDQIIEGEAHEGLRCLRLLPSHGPVSQKIVADPRFSTDTIISLSLRSDAALEQPDQGTGSVLAIRLEDGQGREATVHISDQPSSVGIEVPTLPSDQETGITLQRTDGGWQSVTIPMGRLFTVIHGEAPTPRLRLHLETVGENPVLVDEVSATVLLPQLNEEALANRIRDLVRRQLHLWYETPKEGGLGLIDLASGYTRATTLDIDTGEIVAPEKFARLHTVHRLTLDWLTLARERRWEEEVEKWTPRVEILLRSILRNNFDPTTGLPRSAYLEGFRPRNDYPVDVMYYSSFLVDAANVIDDTELANACRQQTRRVANALIALQKRHALGENKPNLMVRLNSETGVFEGAAPNWFGHIPPKLTPKGVINTPRQFNSAWAIVKGKSFWYHLLQSPAAIALAENLEKQAEDSEAIRTALDLYHRDWDATRYDLENDTDDHYGYLARDLLTILEHRGDAYPQALSLLRKATDHRLPTGKTTVDDMMWIQAVRLGTACAGDSPRAFEGVQRLLDLGPKSGLNDSDRALYRQALQELAANDFKGRQLTNAQFTESFFKNWEMVCICFKGTYQGDCREQPASYWHGDVGDIYGGPPTNAILAQAVAYRAALPQERAEILARLALIWDVTESALARPYGLMAGLDPTVARQYELPEKYVTGLSTHSPVALAYALTWLELLPDLERDGG